jgi:hypothetical protein
MAGRQHARSDAGECRQEVESFDVCSARAAGRLSVRGRRWRVAVSGTPRPRAVTAARAFKGVCLREGNAEGKELPGFAVCRDFVRGAVETGIVAGYGDWRPAEGKNETGDERPLDDVGRKRQKETHAPPRGIPISGHARTMDSSIDPKRRQSRPQPLPRVQVLPPSCGPQ